LRVRPEIPGTPCPPTASPRTSMASESPQQPLPRFRAAGPGGATASHDGTGLTSDAKGLWQGALLEGPGVAAGQVARFDVRVARGLARLGWASADGPVDDLGTDDRSFGYGGTGKKVHARSFGNFGEAFGAGDVVGSVLDRRGGGLRVEFFKNGRSLGVAFERLAADGSDSLPGVVLHAAVCGRQFELELCGPAPGGDGGSHGNDLRSALAARHTQEEFAMQLAYYAARCSAPQPLAGGGGGHVRGGTKSKTNKDTCGLFPKDTQVVDLRDFFFAETAGSASTQRRENHVEQWVKSALVATSKAQAILQVKRDFKGCKDVKRVSRMVQLPSGLQLCIVDSQPANRMAADRCFVQNIALWESLPRGHTEVRLGGESGAMLCEVVGLRKFGGAEEKFGPLAREAGGSRRAALQALPNALGSCANAEGWTLHSSFLTKENGEMCKISFFTHEGAAFMVAASKNVALAVSVASIAVAKADLDAYIEPRFEFAREIADVFLDHFFNKLSASQRSDLIRFVCENQVTLCGESISPLHQHIQSYRESGAIRPHIRFWAITAPSEFEKRGLTFSDPAASLERLRALGLEVVEACDEALVSDMAAMRALEEKHLLLENREGAVVYISLRSPADDGTPCASRTALIYKWKNSWYVTVRAMREKFFTKASEKRIRTRIHALHIHHPQEVSIVEEFLGFYRWALLLLPSSLFRDLLGCFWVSLKASCDLFQREGGSGPWRAALPAELCSNLSEAWLVSFPEVHAELSRQLPMDAWIAVLTHQRHLLDDVGSDLDCIRRTIASWATGHMAKYEPSPSEKTVAAESELPLGLTVVLVRGLQGSGKSTLCRSMRVLLGGTWVNQDEVAAAHPPRRGGPTARESFLRAVEDAVALQGSGGYVFVDKIHTLRQHREDVREAVVRAEARRPAAAGRVALALLNLVHPEDDDGSGIMAVPVCSQRVAGRGLGHLSFVPQASSVEVVVEEAARTSEALSDDEKCGFDVCADVDLTLPREEVLRAALLQLHAGQLLSSEHCSLVRDLGGLDALARATTTAFEHELDLRMKWKTSYWCVSFSWKDILWADNDDEGLTQEAQNARNAFRDALTEAITKSGAASRSLQPIQDPHLTLLWVGEKEPGEMDEQLARMQAQLLEQEGKRVRVAITSVAFDATLGLVTLRVALEKGSDGSPPPPCSNEHPHITTAKRPEVAAVMSNDLLLRQSVGTAGVEQIDFQRAVCVWGVVSRQLARKSYATVAAGLPEVGNPMCELGIATTGDAVDVVGTYDASVRWRRLIRSFDELFCTVTEPLQFCRGGPPTLRGKQWFTFHEYPLSSKSLSTLRNLEKAGQLQTLHVAAAYFQVPDIMAGDKQRMQTQLEAALTGRGAESLSIALGTWRELSATTDGEGATEDGEHTAEAEGETRYKPMPKFYVNCKRIAGQEMTTQFRQAVAEAISIVMGWQPVIKDPDVTLNVAFHDDWVLLTLPLAHAHDDHANQGMPASGRSKAAIKAVALSKAMTQILRHSAPELGIAMRADGFCRVSDLLRAKALWLLGAKGEDVEQAVRDSDKQRFELREIEGETFVRASQGHSIKVVADEQLLKSLDLADADLPEICAHGTYHRHLPAIGHRGLIAGGEHGDRNHIHFVPYEPGDGRVISGMRYNVEVVLYINLKRALSDGIPFFISTNRVLLSPGLDGAILPHYIEKVWDLGNKIWLPFPPPS